MPSVPLTSARPSFSGERDGFDPVCGEQVGDRAAAFGSVELAVGSRRLALAHQHERAVRKRREVARAAQRTELADHGGDAGVEHVHHRLQHHRTDTGAAGREGLGPQEHDAADHFALHGRAHAGGVAADERLLQLGAQLIGDVAVGQSPEAR